MDKYESGFFKLVPSTADPSKFRRKPIMLSEKLDSYLIFSNMKSEIIEYKHLNLLDIYNSAADILQMTGRFKESARLVFFGCHSYYFLRNKTPAVSTTFLFGFDFHDQNTSGPYCTVIYVKVPSKNKVRIAAVTDYPMGFFTDSKSVSGMSRLRQHLATERNSRNAIRGDLYTIATFHNETPSLTPIEPASHRCKHKSWKLRLDRDEVEVALRALSEKGANSIELDGRCIGDLLASAHALLTTAMKKHLKGAALKEMQKSIPNTRVVFLGVDESSSRCVIGYDFTTLNASCALTVSSSPRRGGGWHSKPDLIFLRENGSFYDQGIRDLQEQLSGSEILDLTSLLKHRSRIEVKSIKKPIYRREPLYRRVLPLWLVGKKKPESHVLSSENELAVSPTAEDASHTTLVRELAHQMTNAARRPSIDKIQATTGEQQLSAGHTDVPMVSPVIHRTKARAPSPPSRPSPIKVSIGVGTSPIKPVAQKALASRIRPTFIPDTKPPPQKEPSPQKTSRTRRFASIFFRKPQPSPPNLAQKTLASRIRPTSISESKPPAPLKVDAQKALASRIKSTSILEEKKPPPPPPPPPPPKDPSPSFTHRFQNHVPDWHMPSLGTSPAAKRSSVMGTSPPPPPPKVTTGAKKALLASIPEWKSPTKEPSPPSRNVLVSPSSRRARTTWHMPSLGTSPAKRPSHVYHVDTSMGDSFQTPTKKKSPIASLSAMRQRHSPVPSQPRSVTASTSTNVTHHHPPSGTLSPPTRARSQKQRSPTARITHRTNDLIKFVSESDSDGDSEASRELTVTQPIPQRGTYTRPSAAMKQFDPELSRKLEQQHSKSLSGIVIQAHGKR